MTDRGDYVVVELPDMPRWAAGNYLALPRAPEPDALALWSERCDRELGMERTPSLRWDDPSGDEPARDALRAAGWVVDDNDVHVADEVLAPPHALAMRALDPGEVLATAVLAWNLADHHDEPFRQFLHARAGWQSDLVTRGLAGFYGCFDGARLVASVGLVRLGAIARYQDVQTLPQYRRRGIAGALLATAARDVRDVRFVIVTDPGAPAARVYERVGFRVVERTSIARRRRVRVG
ncbi:MAG TPA: GNAT family N-acetyltransferase [Kofleriaceae bacterium]